MRKLTISSMLLASAIALTATSTPAYALFGKKTAEEKPVSSNLPKADMPTSFADLVETLSPAVVNISTTQKVKQQTVFQGSPFNNLPDSPELDQFKDLFKQFNKNFGTDSPLEHDAVSLGSGFIIDQDGYIITNNHVIEKADEIDVILFDDTKYKAKVIGHDKKTDIALLKVEPEKPLPFVKLGDSDKMRVGDWVIAIGNPYGLGGSVTKGIISARQRSINAGPFDDFLQIDAPINRGNSGGPLFNLDGEVIGINTAIFSPSGGSIGIGFAIPTSLADNVIKQLKETGHTTRGWLGVKIQSVSDEIAESLGLDKERGALVLEVTPDSPASKSDLKSGDIILSFDGKKVEAMRKLPRIVAETEIDKRVKLEYWRDGKTRTTTITVGRMEEEDEEKSLKKKSRRKEKDGTRENSEQFGGMMITPLTKPVREAFNVEKETSGVAVSKINRGSEASRRGLRRGDVIAEVSGEKVTSTAELKKAFEAARAKKREFALLKIIRGKDTAFITIPTDMKKDEGSK